MRYSLLCSLFLAHVFAQNLCHQELPVSTVIDAAFFESHQEPVQCMPIEITASAVMIHDTARQNTIAVTRDSIEIRDTQTQTSQKQTRQSLGHYSMWIDATEKVLRGKVLWHGDCSVQHGIRICRHSFDKSQELTIFQRSDLPSVWAMRLRSTDGDALTQWWLEDTQ